MKRQNQNWLLWSVNSISAVIPLFLICFSSFLLKSNVVDQGIGNRALALWQPYRDIAFIYYLVVIVASGMTILIKKKRYSTCNSIICFAAIGIALTSFSFAIAVALLKSKI